MKCSSAPWLRCLGIGAALLALLFSGSPAQAKAKYKLKFVTVAPDGTPWAKQLKRIAKRINKESEGRIKVKVFVGGTMGGEVETVRALRRGRIQGWGGTTAAVAEGAGMPELMLLELPFLFRSAKEVDHILDTVVHDDYVKILAKKKFVMAQWHENGWRNFGSKKPLNTLADLQKSKMRSQESPVHLAMYKALGVQAESIPVPEVLGALKTGMVDGFDNTLLFASAAGWHEGIKHYTISRHIYQPAVIMYSKKFMDKLPPDLRKVVLGDEKAETKAGRDGVRKIRPALIQIFKDAKIKVTDMPKSVRDQLSAKCMSVHKKFENKVGRALLKKVKNALKKYRK